MYALCVEDGGLNAWCFILSSASCCVFITQLSHKLWYVCTLPHHREIQVVYVSGHPTLSYNLWHGERMHQLKFFSVGKFELPMCLSQHLLPTLGAHFSEIDKMSFVVLVLVLEPN